LIVKSLGGLDRSTLAERALLAVRTAITSGQYRPGDHLSDVALAKQLGVSRGTVRQALRQLQDEGFVTAGARSTLRVNKLSSREARELFRVRAALEGLAVKQLIKSPDRDGTRAALQQSLDGIADNTLDFPTLVEADLGFHLLLCTLSGNSMLVDAWRHLEGRFRVVIMNASPERAILMMTRDCHQPIVDAIERVDPSAAAAAVNEHMSAAAEHFSRAR
jgi:DNA-binding GntR family transcriptional regulator